MRQGGGSHFPGLSVQFDESELGGPPLGDCRAITCRATDGLRRSDTANRQENSPPDCFLTLLILRPSEPQQYQREPKVRAAKVAKRVGLERLLRRLVTANLGEARDVMALQTAVQSRRSENDPGDHFPEGRSRHPLGDCRQSPAGQRMRHRRLQRIKTIVQRQQRVPAKCNDDGFFIDQQNGGFSVLRPGWKIGNRGPLAPFGHGLLVRQENDSLDRFPICLTPVTRRQRPQALFTILYCPLSAIAVQSPAGQRTDCLCRCGQSPGFSSTG